MMNIVEQFGKKKLPVQQQKVEPVIDQSKLHPAAQRAAVVYSEALDEVERLRTELDRVRSEGNETIASLRADLEVERRIAAEMRRLLKTEQEKSEYYIRYSAEIRTHLGNIATAAIKANDVALRVAEEPNELKIREVEEDIKVLANEVNKEEPPPRPDPSVPFTKA